MIFIYYAFKKEYARVAFLGLAIYANVIQGYILSFVARMFFGGLISGIFHNGDQGEILNKKLLIF
jgi:hypothetical protein